MSSTVSKSSLPQLELLTISLEENKLLNKKYSKDIDLLNNKLKLVNDENNDTINHLNIEIKQYIDNISKLELQILNYKNNEENRLKSIVENHNNIVESNKLVSEETINKLLIENQKLKTEIMDLRIYRDDKENTDKIVKLKDAQIEAVKLHEKEIINEMERKYLSDFDRQQKLYESKVESIKKQFKSDSDKLLDNESQHIRNELEEVKDALNKTIEFNEILQKESSKYRAISKKFKIEFELNQQRDQEYALRGVKQQKEIKEFQTKVKTLERSLSQVLADMEEEKKQWDMAHNKEIQESRLEVNGMKQLVKMKTKELAKIKKLSQVILDQRSEVEQFLLEAIEQVKNELAAKRLEEYKLQQQEYIRQLKEIPTKTKSMFPELTKNSKGALGPGLNAPVPPQAPSQVSLKDLSLENRERVLRLLFARMNSNTAAANQVTSQATKQHMRHDPEEQHFEMGTYDVTPPPEPVKETVDRSTVFLTQNPFEYPDYKLPTSSHSSRINQPTSSIRMDMSQDVFNYNN